MRNKLSLSSSSKHLSFFLCLARLPSLGSFSSLGLWACACGKDLWGFWVLKAPEEWILGPLGKSSSMSWHLSAFLCFPRSLLFLLIVSFWVSFSWGPLLFLPEAWLILRSWWDLWFAASAWGLLNCLGNSPYLWSSGKYKSISAHGAGRQCTHTFHRPAHNSAGRGAKHLNALMTQHSKGPLLR